MMKDCVKVLLGDICLRGKSFDSAPQDEHVGRICFVELNSVGLISRLDPRCWTWVVTPTAVLHNVYLLFVNQRFCVCLVVQKSILHSRDI